MSLGGNDYLMWMDEDLEYFKREAAKPERPWVSMKRELPKFKNHRAPASVGPGRFQRRGCY